MDSLLNYDASHDLSLHNNFYVKHYARLENVTAYYLATPYLRIVLYADFYYC